MQTVKENRGSEQHFNRLVQALNKATGLAHEQNNAALAEDLQKVKDTYAAGYEKTKETGGTAWPEFERFVTEFERALLNAKNG